jgi:hypothetical protein
MATTDGYCYADEYKTECIPGLGASLSENASKAFCFLL